MRFWNERIWNKHFWMNLPIIKGIIIPAEKEDLNQMKLTAFIRVRK